MEKFFVVILMGDKIELFEVLSLNTFDQSILGFVIVSLILGTNLSASGVALGYNLFVVSAALDNSH